jgi:hypothetical protein
VPLELPPRFHFGTEIAAILDMGLRLVNETPSIHCKSSVLSKLHCSFRLRRKNDGLMPQGGMQRLETIAALACV